MLLYNTPFPNLPQNLAPRKSLRTACFHVRYRACLSAANLNALLFKVDFPLSHSQRKSVRQHKINRWWIQGHFQQILNLCRNFCFGKFTLERPLHGKLCVISLGRERKERRYFLSVLTMRPPRPYNKSVNTSLLWHKSLQVYHSFGLCHFLSIPSKIHLLVLVTSFQQPKFWQIIHLHSFTELFHKISRCSSEKIAVIP